MNESYIHDGKESWRDELKIYIPRLKRISETILNLNPSLTESIEKWSGCFVMYDATSREASVAVKLITYTVPVFYTAIYIIKSIINLWMSGLFVIIPLNTRFVMESWGAIHFAKKTMKRLINEGDIEREESRARRLTFGARSEVRLPFGEVADENSFNVMEFIRGLKDDKKEAEELYNFLSEASHPNMFQNVYFLMAGPLGSNWENVKFKETTHKLLDKTLIALEISFKGMETDIIETLESGTRYIDSFKKNS